MIIEYQEGCYSGEVNDKGEPHGEGTFFYTDGYYYYGSWQNGYEHGFGVMVWADDEYYEGFFEKGEPHGFGKMRYPSGLIEEGEWCEGFIVPETKKMSRVDGTEVKPSKKSKK